MDEEGTKVEDEGIFVFGDFRLVPEDRALFEGDAPLEVGGRAFDVLLELVRSAGELVTTRDLMARVWSDTVVEDVNVRVHVASLRKALRDGREGRRFIATSIGSGYTFVERVTRIRAAAPIEPGPELRASNLPRPAPMIGRQKLETNLVEAVSARRIVTLVGPGGIGKTALGIAVAHRVAPSHADGAVFVDLTAVTVAHVLDGFASALGTRAVSSASSLAASLAERDMLVVLDNCEHVVDAVAEIVDELLARAPNIRIIATSREALRSQGEWVYRVPSLDVPDVDSLLRAEEALGFSSVALFVDRAVTEGEAYALTDADVAAVVEICRRLDGIPLAIELAASRVGVLGVAGLNGALHSHLGLALRGPRSAPPRQRTLRAMFDWSYATLSPVEQRTLRALAVFRGPFTLEGAAAVAAEGVERLAVFDAVAGLVEKSMMTTDPRAEDVRFRLLESTRAFGMEHLRALSELDAVEQRHATYHRNVCEEAEKQLVTRPASDWIAAHRWRMDDVRGAISWAFGPSGDVAVGVALTVASIPLWFEVCSLDEFREYVERALSHLRDDKSPLAAEREVKLRLALGIMILHTVGPIPAMTESIKGGLEASEQLSPVLQMQAIGAMWVDGIARADYHAVLAMAERFAKLASKVGDPAALVVADRLIASARHFFGRLAEGRRHAERVLAVPSPRLVYSTPLQVDGRVTMLTLVARSQWLEGYPEAAARTARDGLEHAMRLRHVGAICYVLALGAIPVAVWSGDVAQAERYIEQLIASASRVSFGFWSGWGRAYERALRLPARHGLVARDLVDSSKPRDHLVTFRADLLDDETEARVETDQVGWCAAEVRRAKAARVEATGDAAGADKLLQKALDTAKQQGALSWELRAAIDIAERLRDRGKSQQARAALSETFSRFTEGSGTADHRRAAALIAALTS